MTFIIIEAYIFKFNVSFNLNFRNSFIQIFDRFIQNFLDTFNGNQSFSHISKHPP